MDYKQKYLKYKNKYNDLVINGGYGDAGVLKSVKDKKFKVSVATLNQWVLDFNGGNNNNNFTRICKAIEDAISNESKLILFPELVTCGYSCQDHFYEREVYYESFEIIKQLLKKQEYNNILIVLGAPIIHNDVKYNCNVYLYNGKIVLVRPKTILADDGNYREARWFTAWPLDKYETFEYELDNARFESPIGLANINFDNVIIASEICEELWVPHSLNSDLYLSGVDIILNSSGSHFEARKIDKRRDLIRAATKNGGVYLYSNLEGGDGDRLYFDGGSMIGVNGEIISQAIRFNLKDVKVLTRDINLSSILRNRMRNNSFETQAAKQKRFPVIKLDIIQAGGMDVFRERQNEKYEQRQLEKEEQSEQKRLKQKLKEQNNSVYSTDIVNEKKAKYDRYKLQEKEQKLIEEEQLKEQKLNEDKINENKIELINDETEIDEIMNTSACWLWDYLRRSGASGFVLPLSGGADSAVTATLVYHMCFLIYEHRYEKSISSFLESQKSLFELNTLQNICKHILNTVYIPSANSSIKKESGYISLEQNVNMKYLEFKENKNSRIQKLSGKPIIDLIKDIDDQPRVNEIITTRVLSFGLAQEIGAAWHEINIQAMFEASINGIVPITNVSYNDMNIDVTNKRKENTEQIWNKNSGWDIPYQNTQARLRMLNTYLLSQIIPASQYGYGTAGKTTVPITDNLRGFLLVLGSSNMDEILYGYYTKYDASAADINPIGSLPKQYIKRILKKYSSTLRTLKYILDATPSAELINMEVKEGEKAKLQSDETDMQLFYDQIYELGKLRAAGFGPQDSYEYIINNRDTFFNVFSIRPNGTKILSSATDDIFNTQVKDIIKRFYSNYRINRNKTTIVPPSVHLLKSPDDNRFDLRPFNLPWSYFNTIN